MPRKNFKKKPNYKRRKYNGRRKFFKRKWPVQKTLMPQRKYFRLEYCSDDVGPTTTVSPVYHAWAINDLYDPDVTGVGHQPKGFDQLAPFYQSWRVFGARITVQGVQLTQNTSSVIIVGASDSLLTPAGIREAYEERQARCYIVNDEKPFKFTRYFPCNVIKGNTKQQYKSEDNFVGHFTGSPADIIYAYTGACNLDESTSTEFSYRVIITYYCCMFDLRPMGLS